MKHAIQRLESGPKPFWKRILERHQFRSAFPRRRVPLVLFRFWAARDRQERIGMRPQAMQTAIALHLQLSWPQWISNVLGSREIFTHSVIEVAPSVIKELKQVRSTSLPESSKADAATGKTSISHDGRSRSSIPTPSSGSAPMESGRLPTDRIQRTSVRSSSLNALHERQNTRFLSGRTFNNEINSVVSERDSFVTSVARFREFTHKRLSDLALTTSSPALPSAGVLQQVRQSDSVARPLGKNVQATQMQSLLGQPALNDMRQNPLVRSRLFAESAWLNLASRPMSVPAAQSESRETSPPRPADVVQPPQQQLDIGRLSDEVYRHIQRKIRIERERRGI